MSKKLIAIASAAALALTAFVAAPASAVVHDLDAENYYDGSGTKSDPYTHESLETNTLEDAIMFDVSTDSVTAASVKITASGGVKLVEDNVDSSGDFLAVGVGVSSLDLKAAGTEVEFYAYTTSTTAGKIVISSDDLTETIYVASEQGVPYNVVSAVFPTIPSGGSGDVTVKLTDVFGNAITTANADADEVSATTGRGTSVNVYELDEDGYDLNLDVLGGNEISGDWIWVSATKSWRWADVSDLSVKSIDVDSNYAGQVAMSVILDGDNFEEAGLKAPVTSRFSTTNAISLTAQIEALQAQLANTVSKTKYNNLVKRFNRITTGKKAKLVR